VGGRARRRLARARPRPSAAPVEHQRALVLEAMLAAHQNVKARLGSGAER
jgi:hypothetical protein